MMKTNIHNIQGIFADKLTRAIIGNDNKRRIVIHAKVLYQMLQTDISYKQWCNHIEQSPLRPNIDYTNKNSNIILSISAMQAILVMTNTQHSWQLHHTMTDLIHTGFSTT